MSWPRSNSKLHAKQQHPPTALAVRRCVVLGMACAIAQPCLRRKPNALSVKPCGNVSIKRVQRRRRPRPLSANHRAATPKVNGRRRGRTPVDSRPVLMPLRLAAQTAPHGAALNRKREHFREVKPTRRLVDPPPSQTTLATGTTMTAAVRHPGQTPDKSAPCPPAVNRVVLAR